MSIVTLKRKTQAQVKNVSTNQSNFSLNGTLRNQGYVGQTSLSRSIIKTPMRGNVPRGHGGCCGTFDRQPMALSVNPISVTMNDSSIIKSSVLNTSGLIDTKYRWINRPQPYSTVKPDDNNNINSQQQYITNLAKKAVAKSDACDASGNSTTNNTCCASGVSPTKKSANYHFTKPVSDYVPISQGELMIKTHKNCTSTDLVYVPKNTNRTPFLGFRAN